MSDAVVVRSSLWPTAGWRLLAAAMLLAVLSAFAISASAQPQPGGRGGMGGSPEHVGRMVDRMLQGVDATDAQRTQIKQIAQAAAADLAAQRASGRELRARSLQLLTQPTIDPSAIETVRQQMEQLHDQRSRRITQALVDAAGVLTPEQRVKLADHMKQRRDMMERHRRERADLAPPAAR
jgi:Spy/CpxP family protein refolding chaperone